MEKLRKVYSAIRAETDPPSSTPHQNENKGNPINVEGKTTRKEVYKKFCAFFLSLRRH